MTKKMVHRNKTTFDLEYKTIDEAIEELMQLKGEYGGNASFANDYYPFGETEYLFVRVLEEETDDEYAKRVKSEAEQQGMQKGRGHNTKS